MEQTLVSVIIPTYNYGRYIERALDSILNQTYRYYEIIIVDDGSTDNTKTIVQQKYKKKVRYFYQKNTGAPTARNLGLKEARGEFVLFLDADDWLEKDALLLRLGFLKEHSEYGWVYGPCEYRDEQGNNVTRQFDRFPFAFRYARQGNMLPYLLLGEMIHICCVMLKKSVALAIGGFRVDLPVLQDYEFWLRVAKVSQAGFIAECNVVVFTHCGSISRKGNDNYRTLLKIMKHAENSYANEIQSLGWRWRKRMARVLIERAAFLISDNANYEARTILKKAVGQYPLLWRIYFYLIKSYF